MSEGEEAEPRRWEWYESIPLEDGRTAKKPVTLDTHTEDVENRAQRIVTGLSLLDGIAEAILLAAKLHDHGKERERFQIALGNRCYPDLLLAKSGRKGARLPEPFRHEFASVADAANNGQVRALSPIMQDLVLHLIAAHHGRARPHFDLDEAFDPDAEALAIETPRRFARLQRKYGRWGLAYLESLLRAADWAASAEPSAYADEVEGKP
jgi:CRISPR-associated endonuclease/helicase Cas3